MRKTYMWVLSTNLFSSIKEKVDKSKVFHVKAFIYITKKPKLKNFHQDFMHLYGPLDSEGIQRFPLPPH